MAKELYVGHISEQATEEDLRKLFEIMGVVTSVHLIVDEQTGEFKRCGYVRMLSEVNLDEVVETLDGTYLIDRCIVVSIAKPQKDRPAKSPYVKRKPLATSRPAASARPVTSARPTTSSRPSASARPATGTRSAAARDSVLNERPAEAKRAKSARPVIKEGTKTGRSSAAKEAVKKWRPAAAKDGVKSERPTTSAKRPGRPTGGKRQGEGSRPPAKGRR
ncbi:MAG: RNA-binding protein [Geobacteraceae bacterium]|nr:RNA-binding protein [Geobacteraceae bacterium]NTW81672.1 RNA-binding protein [Geobacteraceae bacterium]